MSHQNETKTLLNSFHCSQNSLTTIEMKPISLLYILFHLHSPPDPLIHNLVLLHNSFHITTNSISFIKPTKQNNSPSNIPRSLSNYRNHNRSTIQLHETTINHKKLTPKIQIAYQNQLNQKVRTFFSEKKIKKIQGHETYSEICVEFEEPKSYDLRFFLPPRVSVKHFLRSDFGAI